VIAVTEDGAWGKGSARSIPAFDMFEGVSLCRDLLVSCGGHSLAAGLSLDMKLFDSFVDRLTTHASSVLTEEDFTPQIRLDAILDAQQIDIPLLEEWAQLEPYGEDNPAPTLASRSAKIAGFRRIGKDQSHFKANMEFGQGAAKWTADAVAWGKADDWETLAGAGGVVEVAYTPSINTYNGRRSVQLSLKDLRAAGG